MLEDEIRKRWEQQQSEWRDTKLEVETRFDASASDAAATATTAAATTLSIKSRAVGEFVAQQTNASSSASSRSFASDDAQYPSEPPSRARARDSDHHKPTCGSPVQLLLSRVRFVGGLDISFLDADVVPGVGQRACASMVVASFPDMNIHYCDMQIVTLTEPYLPGYLAFREVPSLVLVYERLLRARPDLRPDVCLLDGNGVFHPRGFGLASHFGVQVDVPTIGVAKNLMTMDGFTREHVEPHCKARLKQAGDYVTLVGASGRTWAAALRSTNKSTNHVYVSIGHRVDLAAAAEIVAHSCLHRVPEPIRHADLQSRQFVESWRKTIQAQSCTSSATSTSD